MTREEAENFIRHYCIDEPRADAVERLMGHDLDVFDGLEDPGSAAQKRVDGILYGDSESAGGTA